MLCGRCLLGCMAGNILKVDSSKGSCQKTYCLNDLINIFTADAERNRIYWLVYECLR